LFPKPKHPKPKTPILIAQLFIKDKFLFAQ